MLNAEFETHHALGTPPRRPNFSPQARQQQSSEAGPSGPNTPPEGTRERPNPHSPPESKSSWMRTRKTTLNDRGLISPDAAATRWRIHGISGGRRNTLDAGVVVVVCL